MLDILNYSQARQNLKKVLETAAKKENKIIITRKSGENVAVISLERLNELEKAEHNLQYLQMLDQSFDSVKQGGIVIQSMDDIPDLEARESDEE